MKKLVIGVLKLSTVITHRLMPSKDPSAYLLAKARIYLFMLRAYYIAFQI